ncbi:MAG TPA: hypothetical protein PKA20_25350 [Burkholderiaceae bacterium]|nr:hypothetical protein [Burkholderiaceae bacterium]
MLHALLRLIRTEPQLAADQVEAYARLVSAEFGSTMTRLKRRLVLQALGWGCIAVGVMFGGAALMLWGALPQEAMPVPWLLLAVPLAPAVVGAVALAVCPKPPVANATHVIREQVALDLAALREVARATGGAR